MRLYVLLAIMGLYLAFEALVQGWAAGDSWFDSAMVAIGVGSVIQFHELSVSGWIVTMQMDGRLMLALITVWLLLIVPRVIRRSVALQRQRGHKT